MDLKRVRRSDLSAGSGGERLVSGPPSPALVRASQALTPVPKGARELTLIFSLPSPRFGVEGQCEVGWALHQFSHASPLAPSARHQGDGEQKFDF